MTERSREFPDSDPRSALSRRDLLKTSATLVGTVAAGIPAIVPAAGQTAPAVPPAGPIPATPPQGYNILFVVVDQERHFGTYPFPVPGRERLMRQGVTFLRHENCSNVCTSSRSVAYTGLHMPITGMFDNVGLPWMNHDLDPGLGTLGTLMTAAGYYSAYKGKWHLTNEIERVNVADAAKVDVGMQPAPKFHRIMEGYGFKDYHGIGDVIGWSQGGYLYDSVTTGQTINWLRGAAQSLDHAGKPWFLAVNMVNPHDVMFIDTDKPGEKRQWKGSVNEGGISQDPAEPPDNDIYRATWDYVPLPANRNQPFTEPGRPPAHLEYQKARAALVGNFPSEDWRWRKLQNYYFNCIRDCDTHVVRILDELDRLNLTRKTIVVFTADHGELGGYHQMHGKGSSIYKQQMHVPMVISHPAYPGDKSCSALTCHLDIAATLLGLTGLPADRRAQILGSRKGKDFSHLIAAPEQADTRAVRQASLYCYDMILYTDAAYLAQVQAVRQRHDLTTVGKKEAIQKLRPDFSKRSGIRCINDGDYKFGRYFSLRQHNMPKSMEELLKYNDIELFDLRNDPEEMTNLAVDLDKNGRLVSAMSAKLNALIGEEIGQDDGSFLPISGMEGWDLQMVIE